MNHKLKYLKLFEGLSTEEIPYSEIDGNGRLYIIIPNTVNILPPEYNQLTDEITGSISIEYNKSLTEISGFDNLTSIGMYLYILTNPKLVTMSIPGNLVRAVDYDSGYGIVYDNYLKFNSPSEFINSPEIYQDLVTKFNPGDHGDLVVKQIVENIEEWGTEETKTKVYSFLGKYLTPEQLKLAPTHIQHLYHPDYQGTTGRDVAKVNAGEVYGIF